MRRFEFLRFELLAVLPVNHPVTTRLNMLARRYRCRAADYGDKILTSLDLHSQHGKTVLRVVVSHSFDESIQGFLHLLIRVRKSGTTVAISHCG